MTKAEARVFYLKKRQALSDAERDEFNRQIHKRILESTYFQEARTVHIFLSLERTQEPDTWKLLEQKKTFVIPRINSAGTLDNFYYEGLGQLKQSRFGILEPTDGIPANVSKIDFVFVPLAAYDVEGNRVGYGKGYYDKFLKDVRPDCIKAGLSFFEPAEKFSDVQAHDVPIDICFTPTALHDLGNEMPRVPK
jgi:5-formyltetrahydrofolate cyclo-ligase